MTWDSLSCKVKDLKQAIQELKRSIQLKPGYAGAHYNLGLALQASGESQAADEQFRLAAALGATS